MIHVAHDGHHWRARVPAAGIRLRRQAFFHLLLGLLLKADDISIGAELPRHLAGQCRVQCLIDGGEHAPRQQARDNFLGAHTQLLRQIFYADAFGDGDGPRDGQRLAGDRCHARWRTEALHRAFLHPARLIALSWTPRWPAWPALAWWRQAGSCSRRAHAWRPDSRWRGARRMHGTALAWPQRLTRCSGDRCHARWRTEALHRAFLHPARLIALSWTPRWPAWPALAWWRQAGSCSRRAHAWRPDSRWRGARRMHGTALAWPQRLTRCA